MDFLLFALFMSHENKSLPNIHTVGPKILEEMKVIPSPKFKKWNFCLFKQRGSVV